MNYFSKINLFLFYNWYTFNIWRPNFLLYNLNLTQTWQIPLTIMILAYYFLHNIWSLFLIGKKRKQLSCILYWCWPVIVNTMMIEFIFSEILYRLSSMFCSCSAALRFSFHSWSNAGWSISLIRCSTYAMKMLIIYSFLSANYCWI